MRTKVIGTLSLCLVCALLVFSGCSSDSGKKKPSISGGNDIPLMPTTASENESSASSGKETLEKMGILLSIDSNNMTCTIQMMDASTKVVYNYNGGTNVADRYGSPTTIEQLSIGEVIKIHYLDSNKKLISIQTSDKEWEHSGATNFNINTEKQTITVGSKEYNYTDKLVVIQDGRSVSVDKLESVDIITLKGRDKQIDSIIVTSGHGYVRLDSTAFFEGGYVEIGAKILKIITENMVIPAPVGTYVLTITKDDTVGSKEIEISENEEMRINLTEFQKEAVRYGSVQFKISPVGAKLKIDGKQTDYASLVDLPYGNHTVVITKDGYNTYTETISVQGILTEYDITLLENGETSAADTKETTTNEETTTKKSNQETTTKSTASLTQETTTYNYESAWYGILSGFLNN